MRRILLIALSLFGANHVAAAAPLQQEEVRACWLTQYAYLGRSEAQLRSMAQNIVSGGMNTVYVAVYAGAKTLWPSRAYAEAGGTWTSGTVDHAELLARILREEGLNVGAWFEYGLALGPASHPIAQAHPDWLARDQGGGAVTGENGGFVFLSPGHPEARALMVEMARELARDYGFDDIQLDRFRWARKFSGREYGYEDATSQAYLAQTGQLPPANVNDPQWVAFREGLVNSLVAECAAAIRETKPTTVVSSAPTGSYGITQHMQRWPVWLDEGSMDLVMPQMYMFTLGDFVTEFTIQRNNAAGHLEKLGVGYRGSDGNDAPTVRSQLEYARAAGVPHGCLWVYHYYTSVPAIQDEIDLLPQPGGPWSVPAENPFVSDRDIRIVMDDDLGYPAYSEGGAWINSAQPDFLRFGSRVLQGEAPGSTAVFSCAVPRTGSYDVSVWYTASSNRNPRARYDVWHLGGQTAVEVDQRVDGGQWVSLGSFLFQEGPLQARVLLSGSGAAPLEYTSSDGVRLTHLPDGESFCETAPNSAGAGARIGFGGSTSLASNDLELRVEGAIPGAFGVLFYASPSSSALPFGDGYLCGSGQAFRLRPALQVGPDGSFLHPVDLGQSPFAGGAGAAAPGSSWSFQFWYRDPAFGGAGFNLSDALLLDFRP